MNRLDDSGKADAKGWKMHERKKGLTGLADIGKIYARKSKHLPEAVEDI
jgi:hypothetical protein